MGELFNHPSDDLVPDQQVFEVARYDECLYRAREIDERPRLFQRIAITMRENVEQLLFFYDMQRRRIRELKREITCLCFQLDEANRKRREAVERARTLEQENRELIDQVCGLATSLVQVSVERDCRGSSLRKWNIIGRLLSLAVVVVGYICTPTFLQY